MISIQNISKKYGALEVLKNINLDIHRGEIHGIVGESGSGKSTLLKTINGLVRVDQGLIYTLGQCVESISTKELQELRQKISLLFQDYNLLSQQTVEDNILLPLKINNKTVDPSFFKEIVSLFQLEDKLSTYPKKLSGGEKQRIALARALITKPQILLCDEPTSALDLKSTQQLLQLLYYINQRFNTTIVFVSHDLQVTRSLCNRVSLMHKGEIVETLTLTPQPLPEIKDYIEIAKEVLSHEY